MATNEAELRHTLGIISGRIRTRYEDDSQLREIELEEAEGVLFEWLTNSRHVATTPKAGLLAAIGDALALRDNAADGGWGTSWSETFDRVFELNKQVVQPCHREMFGRSFDWVDPDSSYEDDVRAYCSALEELKAKLD